MLGNRIEPIICLMILCEFVHNNDRNHVQIQIIIALIEIRNCVYMPCVFNQMNLRTRCIQSVFCYFLSLSFSLDLMNWVQNPHTLINSKWLNLISIHANELNWKWLEWWAKERKERQNEIYSNYYFDWRMNEPTKKQ